MTFQSTDSLRELVASAAAVAAGVIALALILVAPWKYGGVEQWFRAWMAAALAVALIAAAIHAASNKDAASWWATILPVSPLLALLALAAAQWHGGLTPIASGSTQSTLQSIDPAATRLAMAGIASAIAATLIGSIAFAKRPAFDVLLLACLSSAAAVAFVGIAMKLTGDDKIIRGMTFVGDPFARFVNRNNACAFLCAGIAAGCGLLRSVLETSPDAAPDWSGTKRTWLPDRTTRILACLALLAVCVAGAFASRSRGGCIAAVVTLTTGFAFFGRTSWRRTGLLFLPLLLVAGILVAWVGLSAGMLDRFRGLTFDAVFREGRVPHWQDAMRAVAARPLFGAGFGTYGYAHQEFSVHTHAFWYEHADNQYVEMLVEGGATAAVIVLAGAMLAWIAVRRAGVTHPAAAVILSLVCGQAAHAVFDYGIIVPATVLMASLLWGAGLTSLLRQTSFRPASLAARFAVGTVALVAAAGLGFGVREHRLAAAVEDSCGAADRAGRLGELEPARVDQLIAELSDALAGRPDDAVGQRRLGELYLYRYRTAAAESLRRVYPTVSADEAWQAASLVSLHGDVNRFVASGAVNAVANLRLAPICRRDLVPAREHFLAAEAACPRLTGIHLRLAALAFLDPESDPRGLNELEAARRRFPTDLDLLKTAGGMAWQAGDGDLASRCWKASFALSPAGFDSVTRALIDEVGAERAVRLTVADDPTIVLRVINDAKHSFDARLEAPLGRLLDDQARLLPAGSFRRRVEANAAWLTNRDAQGDEIFRSLLNADPWDVELRTNFAVACWRRGRVEEAIDQLLAAIALDPDGEELNRLASDWQGARSETSEKL